MRAKVIKLKKKIQKNSSIFFLTKKNGKGANKLSMILKKYKKLLMKPKSILIKYINRLINIFDKPRLKFYLYRQKKLDIFFNSENETIRSLQEGLEKINNKKTKIGLLGVIYIIFTYFITCIPLFNLIKEEKQLTVEVQNKSSLISSISNSELILKEKLSKSSDLEKKYYEFRKMSFGNEFKDILSTTEYVQKIIKKYNLNIDSISETEVIIKKAQNNEPNASKPISTEENKSLANQYFVEVIMPYSLSGTAFNVERFLNELEKNKFFFEVKDIPFQLSLDINNNVKVNLNIAAYLDLVIDDKKIIELSGDDLGLRKEIFSKVNQEDKDRKFRLVYALDFNKKIYFIIELGDKRKLVLKNNSVFKVNGISYKIEVKDGEIVITNLDQNEEIKIKR